MKVEGSSLNSRQPVPENAEVPVYYFISGILLLVFILVRNLWVSDDAFITLRTIDNFLAGHGLVWNVGERVQAFTHPLWLFILVPFCLFIPDRLHALYMASLFFSLGTLLLLVGKFVSSRQSMILAVILLGGSMSFVDFSSSGLENPLTHFLLISFLVLYLYQDRHDPKWKLFQLSLIAAIMALNRLDTIFFLVPALLHHIFSMKAWPWKAIMQVGLGSIPLLLWLVFATFYYGFPFPNTFYAKAVTGLDQIYLLKNGWAYIQNSFHWDPLTLGTVVLGVFSVVLHREGRRISIAAGMFLYFVYIIWIGGDFMSGRFFSGMFLVGLVLLLTFDAQRYFGLIPDKIFLFLVIVVLLAGLSADRPPIFTYGTQPGQMDYGIVNEKLQYFRATGWINYVRSAELHSLAWEGMKAGQDGLSPLQMNTIGMYGYYAGPHIYILDNHALSDPLLARLPVDGPWRVGHYVREIPRGYWQTIQSGFSENRIEDPNLHLYYEKMSVLIHGDLFADGRIGEIIRFNSGYYDPLIDKYVETRPPDVE